MIFTSDDQIPNDARANLMIVILNLIPIQAAGGFVWDGKKIFKWNRSMWITLVIAIFFLIILDFLV
ncbi:MAG: hypothetical protein ACPL4E_04635 [Thermoproteota archaeon]